MAVYSDTVDLIDTQFTGRKSRHRHRRRDDRVDPGEYLQERGAQTVAAIPGLDIFDAAIAGASRHHVAVLAVGTRKRTGAAGRDGRRLLGIGNRFQNPLEHIGFEMNAIRSDAGPECTKRFDRRLKRPANVGRHRGIAEIRTASDPDSVEFDRRGVKTARWHRQAGGIAQIVDRNRLQKKGGVGNRARDWTGVGRKRSLAFSRRRHALFCISPALCLGF